MNAPSTLTLNDLNIIVVKPRTYTGRERAVGMERLVLDAVKKAATCGFTMHADHGGGVSVSYGRYTTTELFVVVADSARNVTLYYSHATALQVTAAKAGTQSIGEGAPWDGRLRFETKVPAGGRIVSRYESALVVTGPDARNGNLEVRCDCGHRVDIAPELGDFLEAVRLAALHDELLHLRAREDYERDLGGEPEKPA